MKITCIHPSRQRPYMAFETCMNWLNKAVRRDIEYIVSLDTTDPQLEEYERIFDELKEYVTLTVNDNTSIVPAVNNGAKLSTGDLLIVVSDDFDCPLKWDEQLQMILPDKQGYIVRTSDGTGSWLITLSILDKHYYQQEGFIYNPAYTHMFCDTEYTHKAILQDAVVDGSHLLFSHNHYTTGKVKKDAVNDKANSTWGQGERVYLEAVKNNFGLKPEQIKGTFTDQAHINWLKDKGVVI